MISSVIADQYAKTLLHLSPAKEQLLSDFNQVVDLFEKTPQLLVFFQAPQIAKKDKENLLKKCFEGKIDPLLFNLLFYLLKKGLVKNLPLIAKAYDERLAKESEVLEATMITAFPTDSTIKNKVHENLENTFQKKVSIKERVDPSIIGGIILLLNHQMMDASVKSRLASLKEDLLNLSI